MKLYFALNQEIRCVAPDNRAMCTKCSRQVSSEPVLELLPRVRYLIDLKEPLEPFTPSARLLFEFGLHLVPVKDQLTEKITKIVAINLSDKIIQICNGMSICDQEVPLFDPTSPRLTSVRSSSEAGQSIEDFEMEISAVSDVPPTTAAASL